MDVCDKVNDDPENGAKDAVSILQTRLEGDSANQQIYSLIVSLKSIPIFFFFQYSNQIKFIIIIFLAY